MQYQRRRWPVHPLYFDSKKIPLRPHLSRTLFVLEKLRREVPFESDPNFFIQQSFSQVRVYIFEAEGQ